MAAQRRQYFDAPFDVRMDADDDVTDEEDDVEVVSGSSDEEYEAFVRESLRRRDAGSSKLQSSLVAAGVSRRGRAKATAESSSEDEFEKEMNAGLDAAVAQVASEATSDTTNPVSTVCAAPLVGNAASVSKQSPCTAPKEAGSCTGGKAVSNSSKSSRKTEEYNAIYFDSSDEEEDGHEGGRQRRDQRRMQTDEELLYDPGLDDANQRWVDAARRRAQGSSASACASTGDTGQAASTSNAGQAASTSHTGQAASTSNTGQSSADNRRGPAEARPLGPTDAVLNCPACMSMLTMDCQRHETYTNQYRAMFVFNCRVDTAQLLAFPEPPARKKKRKGGAQQPSRPPVDGDKKYHPVKCAECGTEVAVYDEDEVYHFFDVLASHA